MNLRFADEHDAAACLSIYAQYIDTSITFETALPSEDEFAGRIRSYGAVYPWLIAEEEGKILAYAYAHRAQERAAYDWNGVVTMPNDASAALHRKLGFGLLGTYHNTGYKNGRWRDVVWFEKHIGSFDGVPEPIRPIGQLADREAVLRTI